MLSFENRSILSSMRPLSITSELTMLSALAVMMLVAAGCERQPHTRLIANAQTDKPQGTRSGVTARPAHIPVAGAKPTMTQGSWQTLADTDAGPFRVGSDVTPPRVTSRVAPQYPDLVGEYRTGFLVLECVITRHGTVREIKILKGPNNTFARAIIAAMAQWRFEPGRRHGQPVDVIYNFTVNHVPYEPALVE